MRRGNEVICPFRNQDCLKDTCAMWVKLTIDKQEEGKCAIAWGAILLVELRLATEKKTNDAPTNEQ